MTCRSISGRVASWQCRRKSGKGGNPVGANPEVGTVPNPQSNDLRLVRHQQMVFEVLDSRWEAVGEEVGPGPRRSACGRPCGDPGVIRRELGTGKKSSGKTSGFFWNLLHQAEEERKLGTANSVRAGGAPEVPHSGSSGSKSGRMPGAAEGATGVAIPWNRSVGAGQGVVRPRAGSASLRTACGPGSVVGSPTSCPGPRCPDLPAIGRAPVS